MTDPSQMFQQKMFEDTSASIGSPELACGTTPSTSPAGAVPCTREAVHVRLSPARAKRKPAPHAVERTLCRMLDELASSYAAYAATSGLPMSGTYGRSCGDSSETAVLNDSLASRLRERMELSGSPLFEHRWKSWGMPLGVPILQRQALARRTSGSDFSSWPTPRAAEAGPDYAISERERSGAISLQTAAALAAWPSPVKADGERGSQTMMRGNFTLGGAAKCAAWSTPSSRDWEDTTGMAETGTNPDGTERSRLDQLPRQANLAGWPTGRATDGEKNVRTGDGAIREMERKGAPQDLNQAATLTGWATPRVTTNGGHPSPQCTGKGSRIEDQAAMMEVAGWPTPMAGSPGTDEYNPAGNTDSSRKTVALISGPTPSGSTADPNPTTPTDAGAHFKGQLNPCLSRWLQGLPVIWDLASFLVEKPSSRRSSKKAATE